MPSKKAKNAHLWERDPHDWYVEPRECSAALFASESFRGAIWDPACGLGRIVEEARRAGLKAMGTDIVRRSDTCESVRDFLGATPDLRFSNIVSNPPFGLAERFVHCREKSQLSNLIFLLAGGSPAADYLSCAAKKGNPKKAAPGVAPRIRWVPLCCLPR